MTCKNEGELKLCTGKMWLYVSIWSQYSAIRNFNSFKYIIKSFDLFLSHYVTAMKGIFLGEGESSRIVHDVP